MVETDRKLLIVNTRGIGERIVRNDEVVGSIPTSSTINPFEINTR